MKMYDVVVGVGCSFMNGDAILDKDGKAFNETDRIRPGRYLSKLLNCDEVNIANTGSSNERIMREIYNWVESNTKGRKIQPPFHLGPLMQHLLSLWSLRT